MFKKVEFNNSLNTLKIDAVEKSAHLINDESLNFEILKHLITSCKSLKEVKFGGVLNAFQQSDLKETFSTIKFVFR